jgi:hypothetical protein
MPQPSKIKLMPESDRKWLEQQLIDSCFANLDELVEQLAGRGYEISRSSVGRYSKEFKERCENIRRSTEMAVFMAEQMGDDGNALGDAIVNSMQAEFFDAMQEYDWKQIHEMSPGEVSLAVSRLSRAGVNQKKWMAEAKQAMAASKQALEGLVKQGPTEETLQQAEAALRLL